MGVQDLQTFLESGSAEGSCVNIELVKIARSVAHKWSKQVQKKAFHSNGKLSLVVDAECCLDRLYGGYFSDWVCGGQWNRVTTFLSQFVSSLSTSHIEIVVFFNGCTEQTRTQEWIDYQLKNRAKINQVLRHVANKGTPPPKVWWIPPCCLRPVLRMVLRNLNVPVIVTMDDHKQEVIAYCRENNCHGIVADDAEYIAFDPPRYFSARQLKLTYKCTLESKEYVVGVFTKHLGVNAEQMCVLAALLGNYLLTEEDLAEFHKKALSAYYTTSQEGSSANESTDIHLNLVKAVAAYVKNLQNEKLTNLEKLGIEIFGAGEKANKLKRSVQYYLDGTKSGFLKYRSATGNKKKKLNKAVERMNVASEGGDISKLASEAVNSELDGLISLNEAKACLTVGPEENNGEHESHTSNGSSQTNGEVNGQQATSSGSSSGATSPKANTEPCMTKHKSVRLVIEEEKIVLPPVAAEIMRTVNERHTKGLMSPFIHQILTQGELKLPVVMEDENNKELPSIQLLYRPMRQMVYAVLFNLHHLTYMARSSKEKGGEVKLPEVKVREWVWSKSNPYEKAEMVRAEQLGWGVPTVQRLWFGTTVDDKRRRLRAYLTCMRSDTQLMLNPAHVPQHLLILATVLKYVMSFVDMAILRKHELDAIIAMALDPNLSNADYNQEINIDCVSARSVHLGSLLMTGIEYALLVNDACGAPIPWLMACPWLYFDGKLLHAHLTKASTVKNLLELCNHRIPQVMKVERMREAILEGLYVQWARPPLHPPLSPADATRVHSSVISGSMAPPGVIPGAASSPRGPPASLPPTIRGRGLDVGRGFEKVALNSCPCMLSPYQNGGRLEIAGVVVGNWGANCRIPHEVMLPPQVTSIGGMMRGRPSGYAPRGGNARGKGRGMRAQQNAGGRKRSISAPAKKESGRKGKGVGRGTTVVSPYTGEVMPSSEFVPEDVKTEAKRILTNADKTQPAASSPLADKSQLPLVNGQSCEPIDPEQFQDAADAITADIMCMNIAVDGDNAGVGVGMNAVLAGTTCLDN